LLAYNLGLNVKTLHNWDFINPNNEDAYGLLMKILSKADDLTIANYYHGPWSPWTEPEITKLTGTETFQDETYNVFQFNLSTAQSWSGGPDGVAPPGVKVHIGVGLNEPDAIIIRETTLLDDEDTALPLSSRLLGYDAGTADLLSGDFELRFFNQDSDGTGSQDFVLRDLEVYFVPRMIDINTMLDGVTPLGLDGLPIFATKINETGFLKERQIIDNEPFSIAHLTDPRSIDNTYDCPNQNLDGFYTELIYCPSGTALSLFPSTYVYVI
ncbi:unnamed protein product, partial [marine sediment metagenome]